MEEYNGFWVPGKAFGKPFFDTLTKRGLPIHCDANVKACLEALGPRRRTLAVDGGAYVGVWSIHLIQHFSKVIAFEPIAGNVECYKKNIPRWVRKSRSWSIENLALSDNARLDSMTTTRKPYTHRFLPIPPDTPAETLIPVTTATLDSYDLPALDLLKLDVEGHEYEALQGALSSIQKFKPVIIIEEKLDKEKRATKLLLDLGMRNIARKKHDYIFAW